MNVTKSNFPAVLSHLKEMLYKARFVTIDCEMTGISDHQHPERFYDEPENSLQKKILVAKKYGLIQVGLCLFEDISGSVSNTKASLREFTKSEYLVRPFNFYVFPSIDIETSRYTKSFLMDPHAVNFNKNHNMDFQKWIYEGVGYCNAEHEQAYVSSVKRQYQSKTILLDNEQKSTVDKIIVSIEKWRNDQLAANTLKLPHVDNMLIRKYVEYQYATEKYLFECNGGSWVVSRLESHQNETSVLSQITEFVGIREVFKIVCASRKPVIGHNVLMDLLFLIEALDEPVPLDTMSLRKKLSEKFPTIWDTKVLAMYSEEISSRLERISLQNMFEDYVSNPRVSARDPSYDMAGMISVDSLPGFFFPLGFERYTNILRARHKDSKNKLSLAHESSWDAMATGFVFLNLCEELPYQVLEKGLNKVALYKNFHALNLHPQGAAFYWLAQGRVFKLTAKSKYLEIASLGSLKGRIMWIEEDSAALILSEKHSIDEVRKHYSNYMGGMYVEEILPYKKVAN